MGNPDNSLIFTGERVIPGQVDLDLYQEHLSRYVFASLLVRGLRVLDAGCGTGYGTAALASGAVLAVGMDLAFDAVRCAHAHYRDAGSSFFAGACEALPFRSESFDAVVAFEIIEHLADPVHFLREVTRVLTPEGFLVVSTPNRRFSADAREVPNPYHVREYTAEEFRAQLSPFFPEVTLLGQGHMEGFVFQRPGAPEDTPCLFRTSLAPDVGGGTLEDAQFFVAVCQRSRTFTPVPPRLICSAVRGNALLEVRLALEAVIRERERHLEAQAAHLEAVTLERELLRQEVERLRSPGLRGAWRRLRRLAHRVALTGGVFLSWVLLLPVLIMLTALTDLWARLRGASPDAPRDRPSLQGVSVVIPTYNGRDLLDPCLSSLVSALEGQPLSWEVIVVDNGSEDGTGEWLRQAYPAVRVLALGRNEGFAGGCNRGAAAATFPLVLFLNNDMVVEPDFLAPLVAGFTDGSVFATTAQIFFQDPARRREETGLTRGAIMRGEFRLGHERVPEQDPGYLLPVLYAGGGSSLFDRAKFLALGGFDPVYSPFYYEDADLSYRAWKRGWRVLFTRESRVHHRHRGTIGRLYSDHAILSVRLKNEFLWVLRCVTDWRLLLPYLLLRPLPLIRLTLAGHRAPLISMTRALSQIGGILRRRAAELGTRVGDQEVLELANAPALYRRRWGITLRVPGDRLRVLILTPHFPFPLSHGGAVRLYNYIRQLAQRGVLVYLIAFIEQEEERQHIGELEKFCQEVRQIRRIPTPTRHPVRGFAFREYYGEAMADAIRELEAFHDFDLIQFEYTQMGLYYDIPRGPSARILVEIDVSFMTLWRRALQIRGWPRVRALIRAGLAFYGELFLVRQVDRVFTMSDADARLLRRFIPRLPTSIVPNGVDTAAHAFMERWAPRRALLFVGYFLHPPNVEAALEFAALIYPRIRAAVPDVEWLIAGAYPPPVVQALASDGSSVSVLGYVQDLTPYYQQSSVFVVPITRGSGTRLKILEAMACGIPVVTTTVGAEGIAVTPDHDVLIGDTPEAFAAQVVRLLHDPSLADHIRRNARELVEKRYDYSRLVEMLEEGYRLAIEAVPRG